MTVDQAAAVSPLQSVHDPFFVQQVKVSSELAHMPRADIFTQLLAGKRVLHVGYADWPITNVQTNLHVVLDQVCSQLDGVDPHDEADAIIGPHVGGRLFRHLDQVSDTYDYVLVPEVVEHVGDLQAFLGALDRIDFTTIVITAPDAYSCLARHFDLVRSPECDTMVEVVHPDHNCWFTPYTLRNLVAKYTPWQVMEPMFFINGISLLLFANRR